MIDIKNEIYEMDAKEAMAADAFDNKMRSNGYKKCNTCEHWVLEEDLLHGICGSCVDDIITTTTLKQAVEYADKIDDLYTFVTDYLYNEEQIKSILIAEARKAIQLNKSIFSKDIKAYIENDIGDYLNYLEEKGAL
jgi:hypothetical protein